METMEEHMKDMTINIRVNQGYNNYPAQVKVKVDDKLHQVLSIIQSKGSSSKQAPEGSIIYRKLGVMSKDSGFGWVHLPTKTHGQSMGMFYCGVAEGTEYIDLDKVRKEGEYRFNDLKKVK
jgi:hypothetical protein